MPPISNKMFYKPENWSVMVNKFHIAAFVCFSLPNFFFYFVLLSPLGKGTKKCFLYFGLLQNRGRGGQGAYICPEI